MPWLALLLLSSALGCADTPTQAVITIDNERFDETERVTIDIRDPADSVTGDRREFGREAWRDRTQFSFGVLAGRDLVYVVRARAYAGDTLLAETKGRLGFVHGQKTRETLWLRRACAFSCDDGLTCDPARGTCAPLAGLASAAAPDAGDSSTPSEASTDADTQTVGSARPGPAATGGRRDASLPREDAGTARDADVDGAAAGPTTAGAAAPATDASTPSSSAGPVTGKLIDFHRRPAAGVEVRIGTQVQTTDAAGQFSFAAAPESYDISVVFPAASANGAFIQSQLWVYYGVRRRDPTLQCFVHPTVSHQVDVQFGPASLGTSEYLQVAFGSEHGNKQWYLPAGTTELDALQWWGPAEISGTFHALLAIWDSARAEPRYLGSDAQNRSVTDSPIDIDFDLVPVTSTFRVEGQVNAPLLRTRQNQLWLRWDDGAALLVATKTDTGAAIDFTVPSIDGARAALIALEGQLSNGFIAAPYGLAVLDDLHGETSGVHLEIPTPPAIRQPADRVQGVTASTSFEWAPTGAVNVVELLSEQQLVFLVTAEPQIRLPEQAFQEFGLQPGAAFQWSVGTFAKWPTTDAATGTGLLESVYYLDLQGRSHGSGPMAWSEVRALTTAP